MRKLLFYGPIARKVDAPTAFLARAGFMVHAGESGPQLLAMAKQEHPNFCVLDADLPEMGAAELITSLGRELGEKAPVSVVSASTDEDARACEEAGARLVIRTPWTREELLRQASEVLGIPRRIERRVLVGIEVRYETEPRGLVFGTLVNLSTSGTLLQASDTLEVGMSLGLSFSLPPHDHRINCSGRIVRAHESEGGFPPLRRQVLHHGRRRPRRHRAVRLRNHLTDGPDSDGFPRKPRCARKYDVNVGPPGGPRVSGSRTSDSVGPSPPPPR